MDNGHNWRDRISRESRSRSSSPAYEREESSRSRSRSRSPDPRLQQQAERFRGAWNERAAPRRRQSSDSHLNRGRRAEYPSDALVIEGWQDSVDTEDVAQKFEAALARFSAPRAVRVLSKKRTVATFSAVEVR